MNAEPEDPAMQDRVREHWLKTRMSQASYFELFLYFAILIAFFIRQMSIRADPLNILTSTTVVAAFGLLFFGIFSFILTGSAPAVSAIVRNSRRLSTPENRGSTYADARPLDDIEKKFASYLTRSQDAARVAQRRPNALLFVGTLVAVAGLVFFVLTLPGSPLGILLPAGSDILSQDLWSTSLQVFPRLLMLIFIQVLAGIFLRQYRSSMEEFRYYESILRHREAQYLSYSLRKQMDDKTALAKFSEEILRDRPFGIIPADKRMSVSEAHRLEPNEFTSLYEKLAALVANPSKSPVRKETIS